MGGASGERSERGAQRPVNPTRHQTERVFLWGGRIAALPVHPTRSLPSSPFVTPPARHPTRSSPHPLVAPPRGTTVGERAGSDTHPSSLAPQDDAGQGIDGARAGRLMVGGLIVTSGICSCS